MTGLGDDLVRMDMDLHLIFDRPPKTFDKDSIVCQATTVHVDKDILLFRPTGKLTVLIGIEDLGVDTSKACYRAEKQNEVTTVAAICQDRTKRLY